jgi:hypothetical protein
MNVQYDMFNFLTEKVRTAPIVTSVVIPGGSRTRVIVPSMLFKKKFVIRVLHCFLYIYSGDSFVATYIANDNYVADNKRECATIFFNHLIVKGVMTLNGQRGQNFQAYVESLNAGTWGHFSVHNSRCAVEKALCVGNLWHSQTGDTGRYNCYLRYPRNGISKNLKVFL